jgi:dienelactone hydrolase
MIARMITRLAQRPAIRRLAIALVLTAAAGLLAGRASADAMPDEEETDIPAVVELLRDLPAPVAVEFPWRPGRFNRFKIGAEQEDGTALRGRLAGQLYRAPGSGPAAYAVLMSGCGGTYAGVNGLWLKLWARALRDIGAGALALDSFEVRGVDGVCGDGAREWAQRRVDDAHSALAWLASQPFVDGRRIFVMGMSNGARAALLSINAREGWRFHQFAAAVALYPMCGHMPPHGLLAPALLLLGQADKQASATECAGYAAHLAAGVPPRLVGYPGATHLFDAFPRDEDFSRFEVTDSRVRALEFLRGSIHGPDLGGRPRSAARN